MYFEVTFRRIIELQADSYEEAENKALNTISNLRESLDINEVFDVDIKKIKIDLSTMGGG